MSTKKTQFESMSLDELWALYEDICLVLSTRIKAERQELEKRLAVLGGGRIDISEPSDARAPESSKAKRKYPQVVPKYSNPQTSETWSGRGKVPRWMADAMKAGRNMEEFRIREAGPKSAKRS
ncbi:H-NS histone family protein [Methylovirgula sp. 4M-Z18]|uniref:H-NS histone family protein n=1 Tax=Methylovirgula sp. 4M-Z18 TaxID=2293567 RepID=UPI000E2E5AF4|nr:H-NS histone family protein [Methylovirgula sp. 4M-Z18]RFB81578.1 H-NS histone family protein [Methylovirgula sp. 4M-Z18]